MLAGFAEALEDYMAELRRRGKSEATLRVYGHHLRGLGLFLHNFPDQIDKDDLVRKLERGGGPNRLIGASRDLAKVTGKTAERACCEQLIQIYNKGKRSHQIHKEAA